jgi:hypothetical protein
VSEEEEVECPACGGYGGEVAPDGGYVQTGMGYGDCYETESYFPCDLCDDELVVTKEQAEEHEKKMEEERKRRNEEHRELMRKKAERKRLDEQLHYNPDGESFF